MTRKLLDTDQKALEINLDDTVYGTFAEIGAGQEVARYFFKAGAAVGTIAKTMSAYDKVYSDQIYGAEASGRYVCESRLYKMLDHEYDLMESRLSEHRPDTKFFVFADTVSAINYTRTVKGHGWLGMRFQLDPKGPTNDFILHVRMLDNNNHLQQQAIGKLGVNMVYASFNYHHDIDQLVKSLLDDIKDRVVIDMIHIDGPDFKHMDDRMLCLKIVEHGLSEVAIFNDKGRSVHVSEFLYKKSVIVVRGHYKPPTLTSVDVFKQSSRQFCTDAICELNQTHMLAELTLDNLKSEDQLDEKDYLHRADLLNALGQYVLVSDCKSHQNLISYLRDYKVSKLGLLIGVRELLEIITRNFEQNRSGNLLSAMGELFTKDIRIYTYPALTEDGTILRAKDLPVPEGIEFLYKYLLDSQHIVEVEEYDESLLKIFPWEVLRLIREGDDAWKEMVPEEIIGLIEEKKMFGYKQAAAQINEN
ncbi:MAG: TonB-dependent receptor [Saprospiraceae bacterium]|nr:TonB-dependent receptor [Saprospiraceae bacterium]